MKIFTVFIVLLTLMSCATQNVSKSISASDLGTEGLVIVSLTQGGAFTVTSMSTKARYKSNDNNITGHLSINSFSLPFGLYSGDFNDSKGELSYFKLPEGQYHFYDWTFSAGSIIIGTKNMTPYNFEVKNGEVVYIGNIHIEAISGKNILGMSIPISGKMTVKNKQERDLYFFSKTVPNIEKSKIRISVKERDDNHEKQYPASAVGQQSSTPPINMIPMYGYPNIEKSAAQKKSDEKFIKSVVANSGTREKASKEFAGEGWRYRSKGDTANAMRRFNQSWLLNPNYYQPYWGFGALLWAQGSTDEAIIHYNKALSLIDDNGEKPRLLTDAARAYSKKGFTATNKIKRKEFFGKANSLFNTALTLAGKTQIIFLFFPVF